MLCPKKTVFPCLLLPTLLTICSSFLVSVAYDGVPQFHIQQHGLYMPGNKSEVTGNKSLLLAADRTHRKDPLNNFKYYTGGWNITDWHYLSSAVYTAAPLLVIAVIWLLGFAVILLVICVRRCCCNLSDLGYSKISYALSLICLIVFTAAAIAGCIVLYFSEETFHAKTMNTLDYVVNQADTTAENLTIVSGSLSAAKGVGIDQISLPPSMFNDINKVQHMISVSANTLLNETDKNSDRIQHALDAVRVSLIVVSAVMLLLAFFGFLLSIFGLQVLVYILALIGWVLVSIALMLCCLSLIVNNIMGDTCVAMDEWVRNPTRHTALDEILPCVDNATAQETLLQSKNVTFQLVGVVNIFINNVSNINQPPTLPPLLPPEVRHLYYNQSGPLVPVLCNPFNSDLTDRSCIEGEVNFKNASQEWTKYICQVSPNGNCTTTGRLKAEFYNQITCATNISYALYRYGPFLVDLADCTFVRETFTGITEDHCPSLERYSKLIFIGLFMISVAVMLSLIFWVFYARERRHRMYTKKFMMLNEQDFVNK